jgi:hypothetical protein
MKLVNKIGYLAKKIDEYDADFYEVRDAHNHSESYVDRINKCYDEFQKALRQLQPQTGGRRSRRRCNRKTRRSRK